MKIKALLYCTKQPHKLYSTDKGYVIADCELGDYYNKKEKLNGKIVAECDYEVEKIFVNDCTFRTLSKTERQLLEKSYLTYKQLFEYLKNRPNPRGYAIQIKNLNIFDKPKKLSNYITKQCTFAKCSTCKYGKNNIICSTIDTPITKAPQNMMYAYDSEGNKYIVISIQPQWMCLILKRIKDVEVRKVVLKEMLK